MGAASLETCSKKTPGPIALARLLWRVLTRPKLDFLYTLGQKHTLALFNLTDLIEKKQLLRAGFEYLASVGGGRQQAVLIWGIPQKPRDKLISGKKAGPAPRLVRGLRKMVFYSSLLSKKCNSKYCLLCSVGCPRVKYQSN